MSRSGLMPWSLLPMLMAMLIGWSNYRVPSKSPPVQFDMIDGIMADRYALWNSPARSIDPNRLDPAREEAEFRALELEILGTTFSSNSSMALVVGKGMNQAMMYKAGDVIGGFALEAIHLDSLVFSRSGIDHTLSRASISGKLIVVADANPEASVRIVHKRMQADLKSRFRLGDDVFGPGGKAVALENFLPDFIMPLEGRISSRFGSRAAPKAGARTYHTGIDIAAPYKTPVLATASGTISRVYRTRERGISIEIAHDGGFKSYYYHLAKSLVKGGQVVDQGMIIGQEGTTGVSTGPHLHFEIHKKGKVIDPLSLITLTEDLSPINP